MIVAIELAAKKPTAKDVQFISSTYKEMPDAINVPAASEPSRRIMQPINLPPQPDPRFERTH